MNIVFIVTRSDNIGGSHIHIRDIATRLLREGHSATVLIGGNGPVKELYEERAIPVIEIPDLCRNISPLKEVKAFRSIKKRLLEINPDLVSTHSSKAGFIGRLAANSLKIPVLFTAHGWSFTSGKSLAARTLYKYLEKAVVPITDFFITVSHYDEKLALEQLNINSDNIMTIHNGMEDISPDDYAQPGEKGSVHIVQVARFDQQKNHSDLLHALSGFQNIKIHFIGDGPLLEQVRSLAESLKLYGKVKFYGRIHDVHKVLAQCSIFTLISNWEGFPRSTVEAMRAGLPVVVSDVGGAAEAVENGENGFVIKKNDVEELRRSLKQLIDNPELRTQMGLNSRILYEQNLTFEKMYSKTVSVYKKILKSRRSSNESNSTHSG